MQGPLQSWPLTVDRILDHAVSTRPLAEIVTASAEGPPRRCTYAEFGARAAGLGAALAASGVQPGDVVEVIGANTGRQLEAWYAILSLGAVCHPLSPGLSPTRTAALMRDGGARVALIDPGLLGRLEPVLLKLPQLQRIIALTGAHEAPETRMQGVVGLDAFLKGHPGEARREGPGEQAPALLVRTAGASGPPKGVIWTHRTCVLGAMAVQGSEALTLSAEDVLLVLAPFWRAAAWGMAFAAPMAGAGLALPGSKTDPQSVRVLADRETATVIIASPMELQALHDQYRAEGRRPNGLRRAIAAGAPCPAGLAKAWRDSFGVEVRAAWGAVEIGGVGAAGAVGQGLRPCFGIELQLRDGAGAPAAQDAPGRLWARGPASADSPAADRGFVDTGDLASLDREGRLAWLGRAEDQVRGPEGPQPAWPLEAAGFEHPSTARAAAIDPVAGLQVDGPILLVERRPSAATGRADYLKFLGDRLGRRAPAEVLFVDGFPLDAAGRVDKRVLRERLERLSSPAAALPAPAPALAAAAAGAPALYQAEAASEPGIEPPAPEPESEPWAPKPEIEPPSPGPEIPPPTPEIPPPTPEIEPPEPGIEPPAPEPEIPPAPPEVPPEPGEPAAPQAPPEEPMAAPDPSTVRRPDAELRLAAAPAAATPAEESGLFPRLEPRSGFAEEPDDAQARAEFRTALFLAFTALLGAAPALMILAAAIGLRLGLVDWRMGVDTLMLGLPSRFALIGVLGGVLAVFAAATSGSRRAWPAAILSLVLPIAVLGGLFWVRTVGDSYPPVHDVATDWTDPVSFSPGLIDARGPDAFPIEADPVVPASAGAYMNRRVAEVNAETCPGAQTVDLPLPPDQGYARAREAVRALRLELVTDDAQHGRLEATGVGRWLGFRQDVAIRVRPGPDGPSSRIDIRSVSRAGPWDFGSNCRRVIQLVQALGGGGIY